MMGVRIFAIASRTRASPLNDSRAWRVVPRSPTPLRSAPAQNALSPAPRSTITRASASRSSAASADSISPIMVRFSAFLTSGRFRVTVATPSVTATISVS